MPIDTDKIDLVLQFALLAAGDEDDYVDRQLGPIHLIKYVYLADLHFARRNEGRSFTGVNWQFYRFGPWSAAVLDRVQPSLQAIHAEQKRFASDYGEDDWERWTCRDDQLYREKERALPVSITMHLKREVHKFTKDTPSLLDFVYKTKPMLSAAPNDYLDLSLALDAPTFGDEEPVASLRMDQLSHKKQKRFKERMRELRASQQDAPRRNLVKPAIEPRYDDVYDAGVSWLESLAGESFSNQEVTAEFSQDVWHSPTRRDEDVS